MALCVKQERVLVDEQATKVMLLPLALTSQAGLSNDLRASFGGVSLSKVPRLQRRFNSNQSRRFRLVGLEEMAALKVGGEQQ